MMEKIRMVKNAVIPERIRYSLSTPSAIVEAAAGCNGIIAASAIEFKPD
jgi:hypothetical protein